VGDRIQLTTPVGAETGIVQSVTLGYTILQTDDNRQIVVPNSFMANQVSINLTHMKSQAMPAVAQLGTAGSIGEEVS
jgi:small-conductance mechanosensitive channel